MREFRGVEDRNVTSEGRRLTGLLLHLGITPSRGAAIGSSEFLFDHWQEELGLYVASLLLGALLMFVWPPLLWVGQQIAGERGYQDGLDIGLGIVAFGGSGALIHFIRYFVIRVYLRITVGSWSRLGAMFAPDPGPVMRTIATSTDKDFVIQVVLAIFVAAVALLVNP